MSPAFLWSIVRLLLLGSRCLGRCRIFGILSLLFRAGLLFGLGRFCRFSLDCIFRFHLRVIVLLPGLLCRFCRIIIPFCLFGLLLFRLRFRFLRLLSSFWCRCLRSNFLIFLLRRSIFLFRTTSFLLLWLRFRSLLGILPCCFIKNGIYQIRFLHPFVTFHTEFRRNRAELIYLHFFQILNVVHKMIDM